MRISIFGLGYVGSISAACLARLGHTVTGLDVNPVKTSLLGQGIAPVHEPGLDDLMAEGWAKGHILTSADPTNGVLASDLSLVCVGTPSRPDGSQDDSQLHHVIDQIVTACQGKSDRHLIVVRSTALPAVHEKIVAWINQSGPPNRGVGYIVHPEFLREANGIEDFFDPPYILFGGASKADRVWLDALYPGFTAPIHYVDGTTAALVKYANNLYHALKVSFANEIGQWSQAHGADGRAVMSLLTADHKLNLSPAYLQPGLPFGGSCLPKDMAAALQDAEQFGVTLPTLAGVWQSNRQQLDQLAERVIALPYRRILLVGVAFKPGTDDLRESPLVALAQRLLKAGKSLRIYAPEIIWDNLTGANLAFVHSHLPDLPNLMIDDWESALAATDGLLIGHPLPAPLWAQAQARNVAIIDLVGTLPSVAPNQPYWGLYW